MSFNIHGSFDKYQDIIPEGVNVVHHPYIGEPFSSYYILSKGDRVINEVHFGTGGYYPDIAKLKLEEFFN